MDETRQPTPSPAASEPSERGALQRTAWRLLSAPSTLVVLGVLGGLFLTVAAFLPGDLDRGDLAASMGFGLAEIVSGFGLSDPAGSWLFWLLALLAVLHLVARMLVPGGPHAHAATSVTVAIDGAPDVVPGRLARLAGRAVFMRSPDGGALYLRQGAHAEGAVLVGLGIAALVGAFVMHARHPLDARLITPLGAGDFSETRSKVIVGGVAIDRALPFGLVCNAPDPLDETRAMGCLFRGPNAETPTELVLRPGARGRVGDLELAPERFDRQVAPPAGAPLRLLDQREAPRRVTLEPGLPHTLPGREGDALVGDRVAGIPFLVATSQGGKTPTALIPAGAGLAGAPQGLAVVPETTLTVRLSSTPPRWLFWLSLGLIAAGLLVWAVAPDLAVSARRDAAAPERTLVTLSTTNRPGVLRDWVGALTGPGPTASTGASS
jgi:hypothetical protein